VLPPRTPQLLLRHPFVEHAVEPAADLQQPVLDPPPRRRIEGSADVLVLEMPVVANERLELLAPGEYSDQSNELSASRSVSGS
jgi:hypothetical protein